MAEPAWRRLLKQSERYSGVTWSTLLGTLSDLAGKTPLGAHAHLADVKRPSADDDVDVDTSPIFDRAKTWTLHRT